ncbi:MAG: hypothetical protein V4569_18435 [Pseudomonadota bacterium]|jgi:tripartite-type tricarboxylate transporter receptor subunit TctC
MNPTRCARRALLIAAAVLPLLAAAQSYPNRSVRITVPYPAGQGTDVATRHFAEKLSKALGQSFYVEEQGRRGRQHRCRRRRPRPTATR